MQGNVRYFWYKICNRYRYIESLEAEDRRGLSQLITNMARPSLCEARLERGEDGDLYYWLKIAFSDGTGGVRLSSSEFIEKLCALISPKSSPLVRYSGVFAGNFKARSLIILKPGRLKGKRPAPETPKPEAKTGRRSVGAGSWSRLLKRVFRVDVSLCPRCGHDLEIVSAVTDGDGVARYLDHVGMGRDPPRIWGGVKAAL